MKRNLEKEFLQELEECSNISIACKKVGLSRQTIYRWMENIPKFKKKVEKAIQQGVESISDLAESKLVKKIKEEDLQAIKYWLGNNKPKYVRPRLNGFWENIVDDKKITGIDITVIHRTKEDPDKQEI